MMNSEDPDQTAPQGAVFTGLSDLSILILRFLQYTTFETLCKLF